MSKMTVLKKIVLMTLIAALGLAALPAIPAYAQGEQPERQVSDERLAEMWARLTAAYERQGQLLQNADALISRVQSLIDRAAAKGYDTGEVQAALDAFEDTVRAAWPIHQSGNGIVNAHRGFDADGNVTDRAQAIESLRALGANLKEVRAAMGGTGQALREALRAFREANRPARGTDS